jgi:hypothetical protein
MLRNGQVRFGGRVGETDRRQRRHRAPARPNHLTPNCRTRFAAIAAARHRRDAGHERGEIVGQTLAPRLGGRGVANVRSIETARVSRRCGSPQ